MTRVVTSLAVFALTWSLAHGEVAPSLLEPDGIKPIVLMETTVGEIKLKLDPQRAPVSVYNFLDHANSGFYDDTILHRVVEGFVIQGGGYTPDLTKKRDDVSIRNEAANGLKNRRGTIAVARPIEIDSASSEFFINVVDNRVLDHKDDSIQGYGYAVFGRVIEGMQVVDRIQAVATTTQKGMRFVPVTPVVVKSVRLLYPAP